MRKWISLMCAAGIAAAVLTGCSGAETAENQPQKLRLGSLQKA